LKKNHVLRSLKAIVVALLFLSQSVFAREAKELPALRAVIVDSALMMSDSTAVKDAQEQIDKKREEYQQEIAKKEEELHKENDQLMMAQKTLSTEDFEKKA